MLRIGVDARPIARLADVLTRTGREARPAIRRAINHSDDAGAPKP